MCPRAARAAMRKICLLRRSATSIICPKIGQRGMSCQSRIPSKNGDPTASSATRTPETRAATKTWDCSSKVELRPRPAQTRHETHCRATPPTLHSITERHQLISKESPITLMSVLYPQCMLYWQMICLRKQPCHLLHHLFCFKHKLGLNIKGGRGDDTLETNLKNTLRHSGLRADAPNLLSNSSQTTPETYVGVTTAADFDEVWADLNQSWPMSAQFGTSWAKLGNKSGLCKG